VGLETIPPFLMSGSRFLLGGVVLYAFLRIRGAPRPSAPAWGASAITGGLLFGIGNGAVAFAQQWISSSLAAIVVCTMPLWAALVAFLFGQRPGRWEIAGLVLGFVGVVVLNADGQLGETNPLAFLILLAPPAWALGSLWGKRLPLPDGSMAVATQMICGGALMLLFGVVRGESFTEIPSGRSLVAVAYLLVAGSLVAFSAYHWLLHHTRPAVATSYAYVNPLVALGFGMWLGNEAVGPATWIAAPIILAGLALVSRGDASRRPGDPREKASPET
jgi:drug/metabolite transporter (DMT)-like permease